ncbi:hypothetical protein JXI42_10515 [bacterium]|nr:hypothetical protein [bacterium]
MKKIFKGTVEGDLVRFEKEIGLPSGTHILAIIKTIYSDKQRDIKDRQLKLLENGFYLGRKLFKDRDELHAR